MEIGCSAFSASNIVQFCMFSSSFLLSRVCGSVLSTHVQILRNAPEQNHNAMTDLSRRFCALLVAWFIMNSCHRSEQALITCQQHNTSEYNRNYAGQQPYTGSTDTYLEVLVGYDAPQPALQHLLEARTPFLQYSHGLHYAQLQQLSTRIRARYSCVP